MVCRRGLSQLARHDWWGCSVLSGLSMSSVAEGITVGRGRVLLFIFCSLNINTDPHNSVNIKKVISKSREKGTQIYLQLCRRGSR